MLRLLDDLLSDEAPPLEDPAFGFLFRVWIPSFQRTKVMHYNHQ